MKSRSADSAELVIVGAGPGGYSAAFRAAELGLKVTLIDARAEPGGVCLHEGCVPSKALLDVSRVMRDAERAALRGVSFNRPKLRRNVIRKWQGQVIDQLAGGLRQLMRRHQVEWIQGRAVLMDGQSLEIEEPKGRRRRLSFERAILATGSQAKRLPGQPEHEAIVDSDEAVRLPSQPKDLLVVGGGYIGLEMGLVYAWMGSRVTLVEMTDTLLPGADADLVEVLRKEVEERCASVRLETRVSELQPQGRGKSRRVKVSWHGQRRSSYFDQVLVAIGRKACTEGLGLENTSIRVDRRGHILVDAQRRTAESRIYAVGDLTGEPMLAHKAFQEGRVAAEAIAGRAVAFEPQAIPAVVFTEPEVAWCGWTETEAQARGREVQVQRIPWKHSARALAMGEASGLTKLVLDPREGRVIGWGIVGSGAAELIAEGVLSVEMAALAEDVSLSIHPHPTLSETMAEAASRAAR